MRKFNNVLKKCALLTLFGFIIAHTAINIETIRFPESAAMLCELPLEDSEWPDEDLLYR